DAADTAVLAAGAAARRVVAAVEGGAGDAEGRVVGVLDFDVRAAAAVVLSFARGALGELATPEQQWRLGFGDLHRDRAHAARERGGREAVLGRARAHAADADRNHVEARRIGLRAFDLRSAGEAEHPHAAGAFRG